MKLVLFLAGLASLVLGIGRAVSIGRFVRTAAKADGIVTRLNSGGSHPQIDFVTARGERVSYPQGGLIFGYQQGDRVQVLYGENSPASTARLNSFGSLWFVPLLLVLIGALLLMTAASFASQPTSQINDSRRAAP